MKIVALVSDLIIASRILEAGSRAGVDFLRIDSPDELPAAGSVDLVLVDWGIRQQDWGQRLAGWATAAPSGNPRILLFGPHTDVEAHAAARAVGLGPMWARSKLVASLDAVVRTV